MAEEKDPVNAIIDQAKPILAKLGFGSVVGYCSGMALKKVGKAIAFVFGMGFMAIQGAVYAGYIDGFNWQKVQTDAIKQIDTNSDGKLDEEDLKAYWKKLKAVLVNGIPDAGGFSLGFLWGIKYG